MKKRVLVVAPGRGSYTKEELGTLKRLKQYNPGFVQRLDERRLQGQLMSLSELDSAQKFDNKMHTIGENAAPLIFACSCLDYWGIDTQRYEVVAITGNSMGWYTACFLANVLSESHAYQVVQTMGSGALWPAGGAKEVGGQIIYPVMDQHWHIQDQEIEQLQQQMKQVGNVYPSIYLGGRWVIGGQHQALSQLLKRLIPRPPYPFKLPNHAAFHTPLLKGVSDKARQVFAAELFQAPTVPLIDGRGKIWTPWNTSSAEIHQYTLGEQVYDPYDFTGAIEVGLKEFAPDHLLLLGPGSNLGGTLGQIMIANRWNNVIDKNSFKESQAVDSPFLLTTPGA